MDARKEGATFCVISEAVTAGGCCIDYVWSRTKFEATTLLRTLWPGRRIVVAFDHLELTQMAAMAASGYESPGPEVKIT